MALHKDLTGTDLHEPKGAAAAAIDTLYAANGSGSGTWRKIPLASLDLTSIQNPNTYELSGIIPDVSTASFILIPVLFNSTFVSARAILSGAITVADSTISFVRNDGSSFGTPVVLVQAGSAEGTGISFTATLNTTVTAPGYIKIATDGGSTTTQSLAITVVLTRII